MTTSEALRLLLKQLRELKEYFSCYVTAKADSAKLRLRNTVLWMGLAALGFVALSGFLITAGWFLLTGMAGGLGVLFGDRLWVANIVTGVLVLLGLGLGMYYAVAKRIRISRERTIRKYEERQTLQQSEFGRTACGRAIDTASAIK